jgi:hypothetical protein
MNSEAKSTSLMRANLPEQVVNIDSGFNWFHGSPYQVLMYLLAAPLDVLRVNHARFLRAASKSRFVVITVTAKAGQVLHAVTYDLKTRSEIRTVETPSYVQTRTRPESSEPKSQLGLVKGCHKDKDQFLYVSSLMRYFNVRRSNTNFVQH